MSAGPWYRHGLRFTCTQCGNCCTGFSGTVEVNEAEITALAARLELDEATFRQRYTRVMPAGLVSLREKPNLDCVLWARGRGCLVYEDRPIQCRTWPFWRGNVQTPESWTTEAHSCPGMNSGRLYSLVEIEEQATKTR